MNEDRQERLAEFVAWVRAHLRGDEKGEAQIFLDRLFQAFELKGVKEAGATLEMRVKKRDEGGTAFADLVYKPIVLIEMKKRGADLRKHYRQAFDYWVNLAPNRPQYVVLCNFDEFWVYDFDSAQYDEPLDRLPLDDLPKRWGPLAFLFRTRDKPTFGNDHEEVTRKAADLLADVFSRLIIRQVERPLAQRFILQMLVALFAEDIDLLPKYFVTQLLDECQSREQSYDLLGGLFEAMNTQGKAQGGRFKGVDYFNGGLFAEPARLELEPEELNRLRTAAKGDWSKVRPEIFGTLFEHSLGAEDRRSAGAHFTHPVDIMKIVGPTIVEPWREQIAAAKRKEDLQKLLERMAHYTVLDPACGSGNFLYIAYRELKRLESQVSERLMSEFATRGDPAQRRLGFVTARQFFGLDINPFAVELAKVTMMIARKLAIDELHITEQPLPLDNLDDNFTTCDALIGNDLLPTPWPPADVIIGNPPFIGAKLLKPQRGADYVNAVRKAYPEVPGMADYCVYWLRKAHDHLPECTAADPVAGRAGLVGTQNIRNNQSRVGGLDYIVKTGTIVEAVDNQPWSGEANVHVSIVDWVKTRDAKRLPPTRRLWSKVQDVEKKPARKRGTGPATKVYELEFRDARVINSALSDQADVSGAAKLLCNTSPQCCFQGVVPGYPGFVVSLEELGRLRAATTNGWLAIKPYLVGRDLLVGTGQPSRGIIDFDSWDQFKARRYEAAFQHLEQAVLPDVQRKVRDSKGSDMADARQEHLHRWWQFWNVRQGLRAAIHRLQGRYMVCSRVTKRPVFCFVSTQIVADCALQAFAFDDDYSFGIVQSNAHWLWFTTKCSKLTERFRYTGESVFDTFPWPQSPTVKQTEAVAKAARRVRRARDVNLPKIKGGLRALYRSLELPGANPLKEAHAELDAAVLAAYGFSPKKDLLAQLLDLNLAVAGQIERGETVVSPGIPPGYPRPAELLSDDCIEPR
ncbi:MAG: type IIL restriction-modification enzyme MmeI [Pirellulaceae bacterium]|nr:type IIL restriction-modification enzyme MmeI [Pirellulaceae bacterium]